MSSGLHSSSLEFVEELYAAWLAEPGAVDPEWRQYFEGLNQAAPATSLARTGNGHSAPASAGGHAAPRRSVRRLRPSFEPFSLFNPPVYVNGGHGHPTSTITVATRTAATGLSEKQHAVEMLIRNYRVRGHNLAQINPLGGKKPEFPELTPQFHGLSEADFDREFVVETGSARKPRTLREIIAQMYNTYCRSIGVQYMHIDDLPVRKWLQERMEDSENHVALTRAQQIHLLERLTDAYIFEQFVAKKYIDKKSFSLEGAESLVPLLDTAIEKAGRLGNQAIVLGMAHRGRLNVLANILGKSPREIFREFEDKDHETLRLRGDVKYHLGYSNNYHTTAGHDLHLTLCFNPSHLEFVNPVALGRMRAKQDRGGDQTRQRGLVILIHGDAAFAGQGVVQETLNMSQLPGYTVGGTLHVIVNNQIGFTTGPESARSTPYATDVAKMLQSPIFHVNGEDPEAVAAVVNLALDFRAAFQRDVVIDMYCYRRRGHNEQDEPAFTQPLMYDAIRKRKSVRDGYVEHLLKLKGITAEEADRISEERRARLEAELSAARSEEKPRAVALAGRWTEYVGGDDHAVPDPTTGVSKGRLVELLNKLTQVPDGFQPHKNITRFLEARREMAAGTRGLDWSAGEALAYATLATEGYRVRLTGQDSGRGTFSQRHAVLRDVLNERQFVALQHLALDQAPVEIYDSPLSETGVMGFEYGYSLEIPDGLVLWEAQFGDFVNAAQVIIDQFLCSAEVKWNRLSGLVLLLPHGFEGQGPEHSSARLERFLNNAAEDNIQVVYPSNAAQYFHVLRRQVHRKIRKPLIVMTPKSMLRLDAAASPLTDFTAGGFARVLDDPDFSEAGAAGRSAVRRILLCAGKLYHELDARRKQLKRSDVAILRLEQLYPLSNAALEQALAHYPTAAPAYWVQEEPENMGAWRFLRARLGDRLLGRWAFEGISRPTAASPATGSYSSHKVEQEELLQQAFGK